MLASSNGFLVGQSFVVVVFPVGAGSGALDVGGVFVTAPSIFIALPELNCFVSPGANASCPGTTASPRAPAYQTNVTSWGSSTSGTLEVTDSCGGRFGTTSQSVGFVTGNWLPPVDGGICIITARAVNGDGLVGTATAAILTHAGTQATAQPPQLSIEYTTGCFLGTPPSECGPFAAGGQVLMFGDVFWNDGIPGSMTIVDDCGGSQPAPGSTTFVGNSWFTPNTPGRTCTTTVHATNLQGSSNEVSAHYHLQ